MKPEVRSGESKRGTAAGEPPLREVPLLSATERLVSLPALSLRDAVTGSVPLLTTSVRVGFRDGALLVRFDGRDDGVVATLTGRDDPLWKEDVFEVFLSPSEPPTVYYEFEVNPLAARFDAQVESSEMRRETMRVDVSWNCPGYGARVRKATGKWSALLRIPLAPMALPVPTVWRANFYRIDRGARDEYSAWSPTFTEPPDFHVPGRFGTLLLPPVVRSLR